MNYAIGFPSEPGSVFSPSYGDVVDVFDDSKNYGGGLGQVFIEAWKTESPESRIYRKLLFCFHAHDRIAVFYEGRGDWWGYLGENVGDERFVVDDGGGNRIEIGSRYLQPKKVALRICKTFLENSELDIGKGWNALDSGYL